MIPSALIGGIRRPLSLVPSGRRVGGIKPTLDLATLPVRTPWPDKLPRDYDQGHLNACGPNALAEIYEYHLLGKYSRLWAYYWTRAEEHDTADDGVTIVDLIDVARTLGLPPEFMWEYNPTKYDDAPPTICFDAATRVTVDDVVVDLDHLLVELAGGLPVLLGVGLPASIEDDKGTTAADGIVPVPTNANPRIGGHAVTAGAFDREKQMVQCTAHWGDYGDKGTIWLPFDHWRTGNVSDMRAIRRIGTTT